MSQIPVNNLESFGELKPSRGRVTAKVGDRIGNLESIEFIGVNKWNESIWLWRCECNELFFSRYTTIKSGHTKSCGCLFRRVAGQQNRTHGAERTPEYHTWVSMKSRCSNKNDNNYHRYGGRGIKVCREWNESFEAFLQDMGYRPSSEHSIERRNTNQGYNPENCYWATIMTQNSNRLSNRFVDYRGKVITLAEFSRQVGSSQARVTGLLKKGLTPDEIERRITSNEKGPYDVTRGRISSILNYDEAFILRTSRI